jgi:hypothetical protein
VLGIVTERPETAVAVEAQYLAHPSGAMIVIDVLGSGRPDRTDAAEPGRRLASDRSAAHCWR